MVYLKLKSCKLYNNKYMIASTQITNAEIFAFIAVLDFKLLSRKVLFIDRKDKKKLLKSRLFSGGITAKLKIVGMQNFRILLKHVSNHLPVLFQFA